MSRSPAPTRAASCGFTLIELMVTLSVLAILLSIAAPSFSALLAANRMSTQANEITGALNLARLEAVRRSQPVAIRSRDGTTNFSKGWRVFTDDDADGAIPGTVTDTNGTVIRETSAYGGTAAVTRVTRSGSAGAYTYATSTDADKLFVVFSARGVNNGSPAFFRVCDATNPSVKGRIVQVSAVGKISLDSVNQTCP